MNNSDVNRIEPIVPLKYYSKYSNLGKMQNYFFGKTDETPEIKIAKEQRLKEMEDYKKKLLDEQKKISDELFQKTLVKYRGEEIIDSEGNKLNEIMNNEKILDECKRRLGLCKICGQQLDPVTFSLNSSLSDDKKRVMIVGNGKYEDGTSIFPKPNKPKISEIEKCVEQHGVNRLTKKLGIAPDEIYDAYLETCKNMRTCNTECLMNLVTSENVNKILEKRKTTKEVFTKEVFDNSDIFCGHKFHKDCILQWIRYKNGVLNNGKVVTNKKNNVNCPTCKEPIRQLYYFLPSYCEKIDDTGQIIKRNSDTTRSKQVRFSFNNNVFKYGGKRKSLHKTARKKRYHKKTRKYK